MRGFGFGYFLTANALAKEIAHFFLGRSSCFSISRAMTLVLLSVNLCRRNTPFLIPTLVMSQCPKVALSIFWVLIVFYLVWPIALAVAGFWILLMVGDVFCHDVAPSKCWHVTHSFLLAFWSMLSFRTTHHFIFRAVGYLASGIRACHHERHRKLPRTIIFM